MKRLFIGLSLVIGVWMLSPTPEAQAWSWGWSTSRDGGSHHSWWHDHRGSGVSIPELDPSAAGSAVVLLLGGLAYIASRRREEDLA